MIKYMEANGLRVIPLYDSIRPVGFEVQNKKGEVVFESEKLCEAELFIIHSKKEKGITVGSAAEFKVY